jgi:hypothetical protein
MSGGYDSNFVPSKVIITQDTAPEGEYGKLWQDASSNEIKAWDGSNWKAVTTPPDKTSITKNNNGELQVEKPSEIVIGDFEASTGDWESYDSPSTFSTDSSKWVKGQQSLVVGKSSQYYSTFKQVDIDSSQEALIPYVYFENIQYGEYAAVGLDSNGATRPHNADTKVKTIQDDNLSQGSWNEVVLDVENLSGTYYLCIGAYDGKTYVDYVSIQKIQVTKIGTGAGN